MEEFKTSINNHYKDSLFRMVFANPDHRDLTLSLYNAISGSDLKNPDELEFTTIDNVLYMGRKNDLSFIVADELVVAEHQSTRCGNMPVRMLIYAAMVYSKLIHRKGMSPYGKKTIPLPVPKLVCLYNGAEDMEERSIRSLSEAFPQGSEPDIQTEVLMLNINKGKNSAMLGSCAALASYSLFISDVRELEEKTENREAAVGMAIDKHPGDSPIKAILENQRGVVTNMFLTDWNEEEYREVIKEEAREEGLAEGREKGLAEGREKGLAEGRAEGRDEAKIETALRMLADGLNIEKVAQYSGLSLSEVQKLASGK